LDTPTEAAQVKKKKEKKKGKGECDGLKIKYRGGRERGSAFCGLGFFWQIVPAWGWLNI